MPRPDAHASLNGSVRAVMRFIWQLATHQLLVVLIQFYVIIVCMWVMGTPHQTPWWHRQGEFYNCVTGVRSKKSAINLLQERRILNSALRQKCIICYHTKKASKLLRELSEHGGELFDTKMIRYWGWKHVCLHELCSITVKMHLLMVNEILQTQQPYIQRFTNWNISSVKIS